MSDSEDRPRGRGLPIFRDSERPIADLLDPSSTEWQPGCSATLRLWRSLELLRDLEEGLRGAQVARSIPRQKRRLKLLLPTLVSLAEDLTRLCNEFIEDEHWVTQLPEDFRDHLRVFKESFEKDVPFGYGRELRVLRNKLGAHFDPKMLPSKARQLLDTAEHRTYGRWAQSCVWLTLQLLEANVYTWVTNDVEEGSRRLMQIEPFVITLAPNQEGEMTLAGLDVGPSPRNTVAEACEKVVEASQWLFGKDETRLVVRKPKTPAPE
jgi:hypothetical protein